MRGKIIRRTFKGIAKAQRNYEKWSGGCWALEAAEYLLTTHIAREIAGIGANGPYITLEHNVREAIADAGGLPQGRPRNALRLQGRFDILLWDGDTPFAVVEVKNQVDGFSRVYDDILNICAVLDLKGSIQFGLVAFYIALPDEERLENRTDAIVQSAKKFVTANGRGLKRHRPRKEVENDWAWVAEVLEIY